MRVGTCFDCGKYSKNIHRHHLDGKGGKIEPHKTIDCCPKCHRLRHQSVYSSTILSLSPEKQKEVEGKLLVLEKAHQEREKKLKQDLQKEYEEALGNIHEEYNISNEEFPLYAYAYPLSTLEFYRFITK